MNRRTSNRRRRLVYCGPIHTKNRGPQIGQRPYIPFQGLPLRFRHGHEHHEGKVGGRQAPGDGLADIAPVLNDAARHVTDNAQAIEAGGVDDQVRRFIIVIAITAGAAWECLFEREREK